MVSGYSRCTTSSSSAPFMPGMRMSVTTTSQGSCLQRVERGLRAADERHLPLVALGAKHALQALEHAWFVVDEDDADRVHAAAPGRRLGFRLDAADRQADGERGAGAGAARHLDGAAVLVDDHVVGDGQALARALADFLGGEERLEDALLHVRAACRSRCR